MPTSTAAVEDLQSAPTAKDNVENAVPPQQDPDLTLAPNSALPPFPTIDPATGLPLSKNKLKKLQRDRDWEANRAKRKAKRKEKDQIKKDRKRAARDEASGRPAAKKPRPDLDSNVSRQDCDSSLPSFDQDATARPFLGSKERARSKHLTHVQLPVTLVLDCGFDELMKDTEVKSLSSQVTRSYSDCHRAPYQARMVVSSFGGRLKGRFEGVLTSNHKSWKGVTFLEEDFVAASAQAKLAMCGEAGGRLAAAFEQYSGPATDGEMLKEKGEVVYLTSDSEDTLAELKPYSTYIIGGIVDKNRHKGICYKRAMDAGVRTAKLPIGEFMQMQSRFVLATNHVVEIMLRWLECGDWGEAFLKVIPKRKGGSLKAGIEGPGADSAKIVSDDQGAQEIKIAESEYQEAVDEAEEDLEMQDKGSIELIDNNLDPQRLGPRTSPTPQAEKAEAAAAIVARTSPAGIVGGEAQTEMQAEAANTADSNQTKTSGQP